MLGLHTKCVIIYSLYSHRRHGVHRFPDKEPPWRKLTDSERCRQCEGTLSQFGDTQCAFQSESFAFNGKVFSSTYAEDIGHDACIGSNMRKLMHVPSNISYRALVDTLYLVLGRFFLFEFSSSTPYTSQTVLCVHLHQTLR